jgi:hypothetical protein
MSCFLFYLLSFFFHKIREQEERISPAQGGGLITEGGRRCWEKGIRG